MASSLNVERDSLASALTRLAQTQLIIRAAVSRPDVRTPTVQYRLEVVFVTNRLHSAIKDSCVFAHIIWHAGHTEGTFGTDPLDITLLVRDRPEAQVEATEGGLFFNEIKDVVDYWTRNIIRDGVGPYEEWLQPKSFVGVGSLGFKNSTSHRVDVLKADSRALLIFHGLFLGWLSGYSLQLEAMKKLDPSMEVRYRVFRRIMTSFTQFSVQIENEQVQNLLG